MTDGPWIKSNDNWSNWDFHRVKSMLDGIDVNAIHAYADNWRSAGERIASTMDDFIAELTRTLNGRWSGTAATQAQSVLDSYRALPGQIQGQSATVGGLASQVAGAVAEAKSRVNGITPPQQPNLADTVLNGLTMNTLTHFGVPDAATAAAQQQAADDEARRVMAAVVQPAYTHVDQSMPTFPPIKQPGNPTPPPTPPTPVPGPPGGTGGNAGFPGFAGSLAQPGATTGPGQTTASAATGNQPWTGVAAGPTGGVPTGATSTSGFAGMPSGAGTGPGGPAAAGTSLAGGLASTGGTAGADGSGMGSPGGAFGGRLTGAPGSAEAAAEAERAGAAGAAAEGEEAMPAGGMAGRGGRKSEDAEHRSPNYLAGPDDLFGYGPDGPMVISPVIAEE